MAHFQFKQFGVQHDQCAMKIGTDSIILGAWATASDHQHTVLDIGSGTGILALMLAQRNPSAYIEALEIDADAYEQCTENFENSPWRNRLFCYHAALIEFVEEVDETYDHIICNPPFYSEDYKTKNHSRNLARFTDAMPFEHLIYAVSKLLSDTGIFSVILPHKEADAFIKLAERIKLYPHKQLYIKGNPKADIKRRAITFSFHNNACTTKDLIIEIARHKYTDDYIALTRDFYLKM